MFGNAPDEAIWGMKLAPRGTMRQMDLLDYITKNKPKSTKLLTRNTVGTALGFGVAAAGALALLNNRTTPESGLTDLQSRAIAAPSSISNLSTRQLKKANTAEERFTLFSRALDEYGEVLGTGHKRIAIPKSLLSKKELEKNLGFVPVSIAIPESGQTSATSYRHPRLLEHIHGHKNYWLMHRDVHEASTMSVFRYQQESKARGEDPSLIKQAGLLLSGAQHLVTEGIPGAYYYLKGEITDTTPMLERFLTEAKPGYHKFINRLQAAQPKHWWQSIFSGRDDNYNTIEGLKHGGQAEKKRKELTDFGSGWDPVRGLLRASQTFEQYIGKKGFQRALSRGKLIKQLQSGSFGDVQLMQTKVGGINLFGLNLFGKKLQYIRKTIKPGAEAHIMSVRPDYARGLNLEAEAAMMRPLGATETVPSVYRATKEELIMEAMPGKALHELFGAGQALPKEAQQALFRTVEEAAQKQIVNVDINYGNIMYDPISKRTSWVDWGLAEKTNNAVGYARTQMEKAMEPFFSLEEYAKPLFGAEDIAKLDDLDQWGKLAQAVDPFVPNKALFSTMPKEAQHLALAKTVLKSEEVKQVEHRAIKTGLGHKRAKRKLVESSVQLRKDQKQIWERSINGGKGHRGYIANRSTVK